ncbi:hypothetical protein QE152_g40834, partial [Popillia japonica]
RLKHEDYNILTSLIITLFPKENSLTYYTPPTKKSCSSNGRHIRAKGKLVDKAKNLLYISGEAKRKINSVPETLPFLYISGEAKRKINSVPETLPFYKIDCDDDIRNAIDWLKVRREPWNDVMIKWKLTYNYRNKDKSSTVDQFIKNWPILEDARAESLVDRYHKRKSVTKFI